MSTRYCFGFQSDGELVSVLRSEDSSVSGQQSCSTTGNDKLRCMSTMEVRRLLRKALIADPITKAKWNAYESEWKERERTYATAHVRGFERGERGGRV